MNFGSFLLSRLSPRAKEVVTPIRESSYCRLLRQREVLSDQTFWCEAEPKAVPLMPLAWTITWAQGRVFDSCIKCFKAVCMSVFLFGRIGLRAKAAVTRITESNHRRKVRAEARARVAHPLLLDGRRQCRCVCQAGFRLEPVAVSLGGRRPPSSAR